MSQAAQRGAESYRRVSIESADPLELVVMLYDGALRFAGDARDAILRRDIAARHAALDRTLAIVGELRGSLDMQRGGAIAESLENLYEFVARRLIDAAALQDVGPLDEAVGVLSTLREGWVSAKGAR